MKDFTATWATLLLQALASRATSISNYTTIRINTAVCLPTFGNTTTSPTQIASSLSGFLSNGTATSSGTGVYSNATVASSTAASTSTINDPAYSGIVFGATDRGCSNTNIQPHDIPVYGDIISQGGNTYFLVNTNGYYLPGQQYPGEVLGPEGDQANSWAICSGQCLDYCDTHDCLSFNIFTFQEKDYNDCQVTCECRPSPDYYDITKYQLYDPDYPSFAWTRHDPNNENCPKVNVTPSDLPTETEVESPAGTPYFMQDSTGLILDINGPHSLGGVVFGNGPDPNSWNKCLQQCLSYCDSHPQCLSFNIFTFQESDYANCQVTCECRAASRFYNAEDYLQNWDPKFASKIWSSEDPEAYYFTDICKFVPRSPVFDPCLWKAADIAGYIRDLDYKTLTSAHDWVRDVFYNYSRNDYACGVSSIVGCPTDFPVPQPPFDRQKIREFLAAVAGRRYILTLYGQHYYLEKAFQTVLGDIPDLINLFTGNGAKPPATDQWGYINDGLAILAAALTVVAAVAAPEVVVPLTILSGVLGTTGGIGSVIDAASQAGDVPPLNRDIVQLRTHLENSGKAFSTLLEKTGSAFLADHVNASRILDASSSTFNWLDTTIEPIWQDPQPGIDATTDLLRAWAVSRIFQAMGIFIHMEDGCDFEHMTMHRYDSQGCIAWTDPELYLPGVYLFPVYYIKGDNDNWHDSRDYGLANNLASSNFGNNPNFNWADVAIGSMKCQYHFNNGKVFGEAPYPMFNTDALLSLVVSNAKEIAGGKQFAPRDVPCLWNLPVCYANDGNDVLARCVNDQGCCTGFGGCDRCSRFAYNDDNSGLDDWCAGKIGITNLGKDFFKYTC